MSTIRVVCPSCGKGRTLETINSVNTGTNPEMKEKVRSGEIFVWQCAHCGTSSVIQDQFLYHDPQEKVIILLTGANVKSEEVPDGYVGRIVRTTGDLIEKIKIFDCGLDDVIIEMCKFVTLKELGKDVTLKFFKMDGADGDLTFTYPLNGQMEMIAVGFNVYEDCAGIVGRNPHIKEAARGLRTIDPDWLSQFFA